MGQPQAWLDQASALWSGFLCPGSACRHPSPFGEQISWTLSSCHPVSSGTLGSRELLFLSMLIQTLGCALYTETEQNALGNYGYQASGSCPEPITITGAGEQMPSLGGAVTLSGGASFMEKWVLPSAGGGRVLRDLRLLIPVPFARLSWGRGGRGGPGSGGPFRGGIRYHAAWRGGGRRQQSGQSGVPRGQLRAG